MTVGMTSGDGIFDLCLAGLVGATLSFGFVLGFAFKSCLVERRERRLKRTGDGWEPVVQPSSRREGA